MSRHVRMAELNPDDLITYSVETIGRREVHTVMRVVDLRPVPEADLTDAIREKWGPAPMYIQLADVHTGKRRHHHCGGTYRVNLLDEHYPVCGDCGGVWPCREQIIAWHVREESDRLNQACVVCGKDDGWRIASVKVETPDGVMESRYHTRKGTKCRTAYVSAIEGDEPARERLRQEDLTYAVQAAANRGRRGRR